MTAAVTRIPVPLEAAPYDVVVGPGVLDEVAAHLPLPPHARRVALVTNPTVADLYADRVVAGCGRLGLQVDVLTVPDGEQAKDLETLASLYRRFAALPLGRDDLVAALGGGVVGDLAGFAAATWHRGVAVVQLPTTLLAQVDAAIGGKTAINLAEGKNLVGAFHQPLAVLADTGTLATLPPREHRSGLGEVAKYGFIADEVVLDLLERSPEAALGAEPDVVTDIVRRGVAAKARVVAADERESGERALLNYGHTLGHVIEALSGYGAYRHGEAVALGMVFAARLGERVGLSEPGLAQRTTALLDGLGLPTGGLRLDGAQVRDVLARDKKARTATAGAGAGPLSGVRWVLCRRPGHAEVVSGVDGRVVDDVLATLA